MNDAAPTHVIGKAVMVASEFTDMDQQLTYRINNQWFYDIKPNLFCCCFSLYWRHSHIVLHHGCYIYDCRYTLRASFGILGWTFGAIEAVGVTIFVGMSVDYCSEMPTPMPTASLQLNVERSQTPLRTWEYPYSGLLSQQLLDLALFPVSKGIFSRCMCLEFETQL